MKLTNAITALTAIFLSGAIAASTDEIFPPEPNVTGPFSLITTSKNPKYNGLTITGRHIGAGIDLAVPGSNTPPVPFPTTRAYTYYLNETYGGSLVYPVLEQYPTAMTGSLSFNSSSNIAQLWLAVVGPSYDFEFNSKGMLGLNGIFDRWYICPRLATNYGPLEGIAWRLGAGKIDDKDCVSIGIKKYEFPKKY